MLCDENGIGGDGEYSGDNDAQLDLINVFYHRSSGGMYVPRADLFNLKPGVIDAVRVASRKALPSGKPREPYARANWAKDYEHAYEHSEKARAPHTNGPRDVPRCGALSLLQKTLNYKGG